MSNTSRSIGRPRYLVPVGAVCLLVGGFHHSAAGAGPGVHGRVFALDDKGTMVGSVPEAAIEFRDASDAVVAQVTASASSYYKVDLPAGTYFYKLRAPGFKDEDHGRGITLVLSEGYAVYNFSLTKGTSAPQNPPRERKQTDVGRLRGCVYEKTSGGELVGIAGAKIALRKERGDRDLVRVIARGRGPMANEAGRYESVLESGMWKASVSAAGFPTLVDPEGIPIVDGEVSERDFVMTRREPEKPSGIKGTITLLDPRPGMGKATPARPSPDRVELSILPLGRTGRSDESLNPHADGTYSRGLAVGVYQVVAKADGYSTARSGPAFVFPGRPTIVNLTLAPAAKPEPVPRPLALQARVFERVAQQGGTRAISGADVLVRARDGSATPVPRGTTDREGMVRLPVPHPGPYVALAQKAGYKPAGVHVEIRLAGPNDAEIILEKEPSTADPREFVKPTPEEQAVPAEMATPESTPDDVGEKVPDSSPDTKFDHPRNDAARPSVRLGGYVAYADSSSPTGLRAVRKAEIRWLKADTGQTSGSVWSDGSGRFSMLLPEGRYVAVVSPPPGFAGTRTAVDVRSGIGAQRLLVKRNDGSLRPGTDGGSRSPDPGHSEDPDPHAKPQVTVTGSVVAVDRDRTHGDVAVPNAEIAWRPDGTGQARIVRSDHDGRFSIRLPRGRYLAVVRPLSGFLGTQVNVDVRPGMGPQRLGVKLTGESIDPGTKGGRLHRGNGGSQPPKTVSLRLRIAERLSDKQAASRPVVGARVVISQPGRKAAVGSSAEEGSYRARLAVGTYTIDITRPGYIPARSVVTLVNKDVSQEIVLRRAAKAGATGEAKPKGRGAKPKLDLPGGRLNRNIPTLERKREGRRRNTGQD